MSAAKTRRKNYTPISTRPYMPGYGLPKGKQGLLPWGWAKKQLEKSHNYWITTVRMDGSPHTMIVWGLWLDGAFYFSTGRQSRKARNLAKNPRCVVGTEHADEAVIVEGKASLLREPSRRREVLRLYEKKYKWDMSAYGQEPVFVVHPHRAFGLVEKRSLDSATRWQFAKK